MTSAGFEPKNVAVPRGKPVILRVERRASRRAAHSTFASSNMKAGGAVASAWRAMFAAQPRRPLPFRFGYPDGKFSGHLIIMRKAR